MFPTGLAALGLLSVVLGRALAQALPGTIAGVDAWVSTSLTFGAFCSQFFAVVGATLAVRGALWLALQRPETKKSPDVLQHWASVLGKVALGGCALFVAAVVFVAAQPRVVTFGPVALTLLSFAVSVLLGVSASMALSSRSTRALGLVAAHAATASLMHTLARLTAYQASSDGSLGQFDFARGLSTAAAMVEWLLIAVSGIWLWRNSDTLTRAVASVPVLCAPAAVWNTPDSGLRLALVRSLEQLCPHPDPFMPAAVRLALELCVLALALGSVANTKGSRLGGLLVCFALLGRSSGDTPLGALLLLLASLALQVLTVLEASKVAGSSGSTSKNSASTDTVLPQNELPQPTSSVHV